MYFNIFSIFFLLLTVITILTNSASGVKEIHVNVDQFHTCIPITFIPFHTRTAPSRRIYIAGERLRATRHHIIPFNTLRDFMNLVLSENPRGLGLGSYLALTVGEIFSFFEENPNAGAFDPPRARNNPTRRLILHGDTPISFLGRRRGLFEVDHRMLAAFTWMPGNLFYGPPPERRLYDPGENFEEDADIIVGEEAFAVLRRLYQNMRNYINNPSHRTSINFDIILADLLTVVRARSIPYEFNPNHWSESRQNSTGRPMLELYQVVQSNAEIEEITTPTTFFSDELRKRSIAFGGYADEDYISAAKLVCNEYLKHLKPKLNTVYTPVDIEQDVSPLFVYSTHDGYFVYGQNKNTRRWFIKKVYQYGRVGTVSDQGSWQFYYAIQIHYEINGKHYFYGHNLENHYWFIQELYANGKMGRETDNGFFKYSYKSMFYIKINGQHYLYGQNADGKNWFLQILNADGTLGPEVSHGFWDNYYDIQFPFEEGDNQYFAGLNTGSNRHYIRNINRNSINGMGKSQIWGLLPYSVFFPFSFAGKTYSFGYERNGNKYTISHFDGSVVEQNSIRHEITDVQPFNVYGYQYFYARLSGVSQWCLIHFDVNYSDV